MASEQFCFRKIKDSRFPSFLGNQEVKNSLLKWSMRDGLNFQEFTFDHPYKTYLMEQFVQDFLSSSEVFLNLKKWNSSHQFVPVGNPAESVRMRRLKCSITKMSIFDKLSEAERIVRKNGFIQKCSDDFITPWLEEGDISGEPIEVGNELRKMLLDPDSENVNLFSEEEKDEFLVRIFGHLVVGGSLCQYEDTLQPYLTVTKLIYKDLVSVQADNGDGLPKVVSEIIQILSAAGPNSGTVPGGNLLFEKPRYNNFFYLIVDPLQRRVKTFYHHT